VIAALALPALAVGLTALAASAVGVLVLVLRRFTADDRHYIQTMKGHRS
jgi:hypothetical protein